MITCNPFCRAEPPCRHRFFFGLLHHLQVGANSQIRRKIYLSLRLLLPEDLYQIIFEYALVAEMIASIPESPTPRIEILCQRNGLFHFTSVKKLSAVNTDARDGGSCWLLSETGWTWTALFRLDRQSFVLPIRLDINCTRTRADCGHAAVFFLWSAVLFPGH